MNNLQKLASNISGYELDETSARDDGYYQQPSNDKKLAYIIMCGNVMEDVEPVSLDEALKIMTFLELEKDLFESARFHAFKELK